MMGTATVVTSFQFLEMIVAIETVTSEEMTTQRKMLECCEALCWELEE